MKRLEGLSPIINKNSKILIFGTFPSCESLLQKKYYSDTRNKFWPILFEVFKSSISHDYADRLILIKKNRIALWDVIHECYREGSSSDKKDIDPTPNSMGEFLEAYPSINRIIFNGGAAEKYFCRFYPTLSSIHKERFISTSGSTFGKTFKGKVKEWKGILNYI